MKLLTFIILFTGISYVPSKDKIKVTWRPDYSQEIVFYPDSVTHYKGDRVCLWIGGVCKTVDKHHINIKK